MMTYADFKRLDIRIGQVVSAQRVEGSDKLLKLEVDLATEKRQIVAGMAEFFAREYLMGQRGASFNCRKGPIRSPWGPDRVA